MGEYLHTKAKTINTYMDKWKILPWDCFIMRTAYTWAGHMIRMYNYDPQRLLLKAFNFHDLRYLRILEDVFGGQCHQKQIHVWRFERQFYKYVGDDWQSYAEDSAVLDQHQNEWLKWRADLV